EGGLRDGVGELVASFPSPGVPRQLVVGIDIRLKQGDPEGMAGALVPFEQTSENQVGGSYKSAVSYIADIIGAAYKGTDLKILGKDRGSYYKQKYHNNYIPHRFSKVCKYNNNVFPTIK